MPFLEIARNEGSVCDYLFECRCRSRPMQCGKALCGSPCIRYRAQTIALCETKKSSPVTTIWNQQNFTELWTKEYLCVFDMNREMEKKITPQGGGLCIFWSYFLLHFHFCTLQVQCQVFPLRPTIMKEVGDEFVSDFRFCLMLKAFVLLTPFCQCVALREYAQSQ